MVGGCGMSQVVGAVSNGRVRQVAAGVALGIGVYVLLDIVLQLLPPHYSPIRQAESDMGVGPYGWLMDLNFLLRGAVSMGTAWLLARLFPAGQAPRFGLGAIWTFGIGSAILAFFPTDILDDRRLVPNPVPTVHGEVHLVVAALAFIAVALGMLIVAFALSRSPALAAARPLAIALAVLAALALLALRPMTSHHAGGLPERLFLGLSLLWMFVLAVRARHAQGAVAP